MNKSISRWLSVIALSLLSVAGAAGCASSGTAAGPQIELKLEQLPDAGFAVEEKGAVSIAYLLTIRNGLAEPITLRKLQMRAIGDSPYTLRDTPIDLEQAVAPGEEAQATFTMWSYPREQRSSTKKAIWVSGVAHFDRPSGPLRREFTLSFREP